MAFNDPRWAGVAQSIASAIAGPDPIRRAQTEAFLGSASRNYAEADLSRQTQDYREQIVQNLLDGATRGALAYGAGAGGDYAQHLPEIVAGAASLPDAAESPEIAARLSANMGVQDFKDTPVGFAQALAARLAGGGGRGGGGTSGAAAGGPVTLSPTQRQLIQNAVRPYLAQKDKVDPSLAAAVQNGVIEMIAGGAPFEEALADVTGRIGRAPKVNPGGTIVSRLLGIDTSPDTYEDDPAGLWTLLAPDMEVGSPVAAPAEAEPSPVDPSGSGDATPRLAPPGRAIEALLADPSLAAQFDAKYGTGAAAAYLGQR